MVGHDIRLQRLLPDGQRIIILPLDHGEFQGPRKGLVNVAETVDGLHGYDAVLLSPGMLIRCAGVIGRRRGLVAITRLNWNADYCFQWGYEDGTHGRVVSPAGALALGADVGLASVSLGTSSPAQDTAAVVGFAALAEEARRVGLPLGGEYYPAGDISRFSADEFHDLVLKSVRIISELGADFIKTFYTGPRFHEVIEAAQVPIIVLGASKEREAQALRKAADGVAAGARGVVFGRNVFESERPQDFLDALGAVVRDGARPEDAAREHGFAL